ncbi:MAG: exodeoxyribonuclease III, partial [Pseudomonadota bacterium]
MAVPFRIITWNINSVRLRIGLVEKLLATLKPDLLCLQEIKCRTEEFPSSAIKHAGYEHQAVHGQKGYHGVAMIARHPLSAVNRRAFCGEADARHISADIGIGGSQLTVHNYYVPAGGDEPDPAKNPKFAHKLAFVEEMRGLYAADHAARKQTILVGDLNIAPLETDVWSHKQLLKVVSHTPVETEGLNRVLNEGGWIDAVRTHIPPEERLYTWWSYRSPNWQESDKGRRLDHVWITPDLNGSLKQADVHKSARGWEKPSDHAPVIVDFEL